MKTRYIADKFYLDVLIVITIFLLDRISKLTVINLDKKSFSSEIFLSKFLNIQLIWNDGIAFGILSFSEKNLYSILTMIILLVIFLILMMIIKSSGLKRYSLLMILGGAIGNFYDRVFYQAVPDFIDFHIGNLHWFIFNVADIFITLGVIFMIFLEIIDKNNLNKI